MVPIVGCLLALLLALGAAAAVIYRSATAQRAETSRPVKEKRASLRTKVNCRASLEVTGDVRGRAATVRCANISEYGALVLSAAALEPGTAIVLRIPALRLMGIGKVRHSTKRRSRYALGLEFKSALQRAELGDWTVRAAVERKSA